MPPRHLHAVARPAAWAAIGMLALPIVAGAQARLDRLEIADIYDPERRAELLGPPAPTVRWLDAERYLDSRTTEGDVELRVVDADSGRVTPLFDADEMVAALDRVPGVARADAERVARRRSYDLSPDGTATLLTIADDLYHYDFDTSRVTRLTFTAATEEVASFSPDGRMVAFVRDHDLFVVDVERARERALTADGDPETLNGKLDWVYQEEIYGRGRFRAYWWSPDSTRLAYLQTDERPVPTFTVVDHVPYRGRLETVRYPKAGDPNPRVRLGVVGAAGGATVWVDTSTYAPIDFLVVGVDWSPDGRQVVHQVQDRQQTWLDLNVADPSTGESTTLVHETTEAWVDVLDAPAWLADGSFVWRSQRSGWAHLYHVAADGEVIGQLTDGEWEVRAVHGIDEEARWIYVSGTKHDPIGLDVYAVPLDGGEPRRLSGRDGTHVASFNPSLTRYLDRWSDVSTPPQIRLHAADGGELRLVHATEPPGLASRRLSTPEFVQVATRDGFVMEAMLIKPPDFDPSRRYPVYQHTYAGPHAQQVRNAWSGSTYLFHQLLAQRGIVVWICDNRTASGKGAESTWPVYRRFGELELRDIEDGLDWLAGQPWVDTERIGISGWSYGGFMVSYAMTHSRRFAFGIAGGSVTDWRDYDTIYTERYMGLPQENVEGYRASSPRFAAADLHGRLLLIHGTMDDNVHLQNTLQFVLALQEAGKQFDLMLYPSARHGVSDPDQVQHMREMMLRFVLERARGDTGEGATRRTAGP